jgi:hypothetical protein
MQQQPAADRERPPAAAPAGPGAMTKRKLKDITDVDHDMVVGSVGLQMVYVASITPVLSGAPAASSLDSLTELGIRIWFTRRVGLDAGLGFAVAHIRDTDYTGVGFALTAGVPFALGIYRHLTMFAGPELGFGLVHPGPDTNRWSFQLKGKAGIELSLGFIDIPRLSLLGTMSLGIRTYNDGDNTEIRFGTETGFSLQSLWETSFGVVFYI